jgi:uncharacterized protein (TIGR03382 family)
MKKTLITAACALVSVGAFGQGLLYMSNNNPINDNTGAPIGSASGTDITVELLEGATASTLAPVASSINNVNQGYFYGPGTGVITISGAAAGTVVDYAIEVWSTSAGSYAAAQTKAGSLWGESAVNTYTLGGGSPPVAPSPLNFASFNASLTPTVGPEPTTIALGAMSAGALLLFRRRK